jgi:hypothetical protein
MAEEREEGMEQEAARHTCIEGNSREGRRHICNEYSCMYM